jgi:hypothetical protein
MNSGQAASTTRSVPFCVAVLLRHDQSDLDRGYELNPSDCKYDPVSQLCETIWAGETSPTTWSRVSSTFLGDPDESEDDKGKD